MQFIVSQSHMLSQIFILCMGSVFSLDGPGWDGTLIRWGRRSRRRRRSQPKLEAPGSIKNTRNKTFRHELNIGPSSFNWELYTQCDTPMELNLALTKIRIWASCKFLLCLRQRFTMNEYLNDEFIPLCGSYKTWPFLFLANLKCKLCNHFNPPPPIYTQNNE